MPLPPRPFLPFPKSPNTILLAHLIQSLKQVNALSSETDFPSELKTTETKEPLLSKEDLKTLYEFAIKQIQSPYFVPHYQEKASLFKKESLAYHEPSQFLTTMAS